MCVEEPPPTTAASTWTLPSKGSQVGSLPDVDGEIVGTHDGRYDVTRIAGKEPRRSHFPPPEATEAMDTHQIWPPRERP